jgi:hypothetical protein
MQASQRANRRRGVASTFLRRGVAATRWLDVGHIKKARRLRAGLFREVRLVLAPRGNHQAQHVPEHERDRGKQLQ